MSRLDRLTEQLNNLIDEYTSQYESIVSLESWGTEDLMELHRIAADAIEIRAGEYTDPMYMYEDSEYEN